jgi:hypothetical protein
MSGEYLDAAGDSSLLEKGEPVWVDGRPATFVGFHPSGQAAVVRYDGEQATRVVALRKLQRLPQPPRAA